MRPFGPKNALTSWIQRQRAGHRAEVLRRRRGALRRPEVIGDPEVRVATPLHRARRTPLELTVACILDEFSWDNLSPEAHFYRVPGDRWRDALATNPPSFLLVESAWRGNDDAWAGRIEDLAPGTDDPLARLVKTCRAMGIPTVFWNKEDPPHYRRFIGAARLFEYIFTSDANCLPQYKRDAPNSRLGVLPFAAQPLLQNPVNRSLFGQKGDVCFAGAWYPQHPERHADTRMLLRAASAFDLTIYDRFLNYQHGYRNRFPEEFQPMIRGSLSFDEMQSAYRQFPVFLNVNSVKDSPTMFSRRVLELLACGTAVVSGYARGIDELLGSDVVPMCHSVQEARQVIARLLTDERHRDEIVIRAQRRIFAEHTYRHRMRTICDVLSLDAVCDSPTVTVAIICNDRAGLERMLGVVESQSFSVSQLLIVCAESEIAKTNNWMSSRSRIPMEFVCRGGENSEWIEFDTDWTERITSDFLALFDSRDHYGCHYLTDAIHALAYSGGEIVGKSAHFLRRADAINTLQLDSEHGAEQHTFVQSIPLGTLVVQIAALPGLRICRCSSHNPMVKLSERAVLAGRRIYSAGPYNYVRGLSGALKMSDGTNPPSPGLRCPVDVCF